MTGTNPSEACPGPAVTPYPGERTHMKVKSPRVRTTVVGGVAALALAVAGLAAVSLAAVGSTPSRPAAHVAAASRAELTAKARIALTRYLSQDRPRAQLVKPGGVNQNAQASGASAVESFNWSGYADVSTAGAFTGASATWRQPATVCSPEQRLTAFWVGLDGFDNATVEQLGTLAYCFEGLPYYFSWWEMFPGASVTVGSTVQPGDLISASVQRSGTSYTLTLVDATTPGNSFSTVQSCATCENDSAEWIAERPAFPIGITPLSFFRSWNVMRGSQTSDGVTGSIGSGPSPTQITMIDATATYPLDSVSGLLRGGSSLRARWLNSY
jgi:Peptidase A4 family